MPAPLVSPQILGQYRPVLMNRWQVSTLSWTPWDGSLTTGALTIGKVDQGIQGLGASPWFTTSGFGLPAFDAVVPDFSGATSDVYVFKTGGTGGTTVATITINYSAASKLTTTSFVKT